MKRRWQFLWIALAIFGLSACEDDSSNHCSPACGDGLICVNMQCVPEASVCAADADCEQRSDGKTKCNLTTQICETPSLAECSSDNDCAQRTDGKTKCDLATQICVAPESTCPNAIREGSEQCDGTDFGTSSCANVDAAAFVDGMLKCSDTCVLDTSACVQCTKANLSLCTEGQECSDAGKCVDPAPRCGDNLKNQDSEECDGDIGTATCASVGAYISGTLSCNNSCKFDTSLCNECSATDLSNCDTGDVCSDTGKCVPPDYKPGCPSGKVDAGEDCDGTDLNGKTCADMTGFGGGTLKCSTSCKYDTSACLECVVASDCAGRTDGKTVCTNNVCVAPPTAECSSTKHCATGSYCLVNVVDPLRNVCLPLGDCKANGCATVGGKSGLCSGVAWNSPGAFSACVYGCAYMIPARVAFILMPRCF